MATKELSVYFMQHIRSALVSYSWDENGKIFIGSQAISRAQLLQQYSYRINESSKVLMTS
eukprot:scaffold83712_cov42-Prasinocladus_malaysianus.AAC.1